MGWAAGNKNYTLMFIQCLECELIFLLEKASLFFINFILHSIDIMGFVPLRKVGAGKQMLVLFKQNLMLMY